MWREVGKVKHQRLTDLSGVYVIRSNRPEKELSAEDTVGSSAPLKWLGTRCASRRLETIRPSARADLRRLFWDDALRVERT